MKNVQSIDLEVGDKVFAFLDEPDSPVLVVVAIDEESKDLILKPEGEKNHTAYEYFMSDEDGTIRFPLYSGQWTKL